MDVSVSTGMPGFLDILRVVAQELVVESIITASELDDKNPVLLKQVYEILGGDMPREKIPHEEFKQRIQLAKCVIRTGEATPYANVILVGGVNF